MVWRDKVWSGLVWRGLHVACSGVLAWMEVRWHGLEVGMDGCVGMDRGFYGWMIDPPGAL